MAIAEELQVVIRAEVDKAIRNLQSFERQMGGTETRARRLRDSLTSVGRTMTRSLTLPLAAAGAASVKFAADIERQQTAFGVLLQDVERGNQLFEELKTFSAETPLQLDDITKASQTLLAFGTNAENVQDQIRMIGDVAQGQAEKLDRITLAFGKIQARGKASMEEINVLIEAGVPIIAELARNIGIAESEVFDFVSSGKIGFAEIQGALESMTGAGGQFEGMMEKIAQTTAGKWSTAVDNAKLALAEFGEELLPIANEVLDFATYAARAFGDMDSETKKLILTVGGITAAMGPLAVAIGGVSTAMKTLVAPPTGWIVLAIGALTALGTVLINTRRRHKEYEDQLYNTADALKELNEQEQIQLRSKFAEEQKEIAEDLNEALADRARASRELAEAEQAVADARTGVEARIAGQQVREATAAYNIANRELEKATEKYDALKEAIGEVDAALADDLVPDVNRATTEVEELGTESEETAGSIRGIADAIADMAAPMRELRLLSGGSDAGGSAVDMLDLTGFAQDYEDSFSAVMDSADAWRAYEQKLLEEQKQEWIDYYQARIDAAKNATEEITRSEELFANHLNRLEIRLEPQIAEGVEGADWLRVGADVASAFEDVLTSEDLNETFASLAESIGNMIVPGLGTIAGALIRIAAFFDAHAREYEERMEELNDTLTEEIQIRDDALRDLRDAFALEFDVLRDQWQRNLIDTDQFVDEMERLNEQYEEEEDDIEAEVRRIRELMEKTTTGRRGNDDGPTPGRDRTGYGNSGQLDSYGRAPGHPQYGSGQPSPGYDVPMWQPGGGSGDPGAPERPSGSMYVSSPFMSASGGGITLNMNGPVYGFDDFGEQAYAAIEKARLRGRIPA